MSKSDRSKFKREKIYVFDEFMTSGIDFCSGIQVAFQNAPANTNLLTKIKKMKANLQ